MKCDLCEKPGTNFVKVNHPVHGVIRICEECYRKEHDHLLPFMDDRDSGCCHR